MRILYDASQAVREAAIARELADALKRGHGAVLVVPEQYTLETERWLSQALKGMPRLKLDIVSFNRLAHRLVDGKRGASRRLLDRSGHLMALQRIILAHQSELISYGRVAGRTGFVQETEGLLKELKLSGIGPDQLRACAGGEDTPALLAAKLQDLSLLYGAYEAWLAAGYLDDTDRLQRLDSVLQAERPFGGSRIWFHGFRSFTHVEWQLIQTLYGQTAQTTFSLGIPDLEAKAVVFAPVRRTVERLTRMSQEGGSLTLVPCGDSAVMSSHPGNAVFGLATPAAFTGLSVEVNRCATAFQEIEVAVQVMLGWAQDDQWHWRDIMVVTPAEPFWQEMLERVCRRCGIPLFVDAKVSLAAHPLARYLLDLITVAGSGLNGEAVCRALKWGYAGIGREQAEQLENYVLARGIRSYRWSYSQQAPPEIAPAMAWVAEALGELSKALTAQPTAEQRTDCLIAFLNETGVQGLLAEEQERLTAQERFEEALVQGQVWEKLMAVLEQVKALLGPEKLTLEDYGDVLKAGLETVEIGVIPPTADQVATGTLFRSRSSHVKGLLILGANEGQLPAYDSGDGLLLNEEKLLLASKGIPLESDRDTRGSEEEYALYELLGKAEDRLYVSCALKDSGGERLAESWFYEVLAAEKGGAVQAYEAPRNQPGHPTAFLSLLAELKRENIPLKTHQQAAMERLVQQAPWQDALQSLEAGKHHRYQVSPLEPGTVEALMGQTLVLNATGLERYTRCPFAWFVRYGLKPQPRKKYAVEIPDMGTLFHSAVDRFIRQHRDADWAAWPPEAVARALDPIVSELAQHYGHGILEDNARNRFLKKKVNRLSLRALTTLARQLQAGSFEIAGTELAFDMRPEKNGLPPLVLETADGRKLVVQGRIDRVDLCPLQGSTYGRIIDYKSGRPRFSLSDFAQGLELQLAVYLDVLNRHGEALSPGGVIPAGFLYFYLDDPLIDPPDDRPETLEKSLYRELRMEGLLVEDMAVLTAMDEALADAKQSAVIPVSLKQDGTPSAVSSVISQEAMGALLVYAEEIIRQNGSAILAGSYAVAPCQTEQGMACINCDYLPLCQFDPGAEETPRRILRKMSSRAALGKILGRTDHEHPMDNGTE